MKSSEIFKDDNSIQQFFDKVFDNHLDLARSMNEQLIWRNLLYMVGEQYLEYLRSTKSFRRRVIPDYVPTPVSNEIREFIRSINAFLSNQKNIPRVWPNTNEREDKEAADLGQFLLVSMDQSNDGDFFDELEKIRIWLCVSGTAFMRAFPDANGGQWVSDGEEIWKTGDVGTSCITPFNIRLDSSGDTLKKKRWIGVQSLEDPEWVEDTFKVKIEPRGKESAFMDYSNRLAKLITSVSPWKGANLDFQSLDSTDEDVVLFREIEFKPTMRHPQGQYFISCGGKIIYKRDRMPIKSTLEELHYSLTDFHYNYVPGRFWSDAAINDLISPQNTINEIDQDLAVNRKGCARPTIFMPGEIGLKKVEGVRGVMVLQYNPLMSGGQKPNIENGTPYPAQVLEERKFQKQQIQDSGGDPKNVLRGASPSAQSSGVQLDILRETVERGKAPDIDRYNRALTKVYKKRLLLAQEIYKEDRILKITGRGNKIKIKKFKSADLRGNTDVRLELDSGLIATKSGQTQVLLSMIQSGFFGDVQQRPEIQEELFRRFGMASFSEEENSDVNRAEKENMMLSSGEKPSVQIVEMAPNPQDPQAQPQPQTMVEDPLFKYDNHAIHYKEHLRFAFSDEFTELPEQLKVIFLAHTDTHRMEIDNVKPDMRQYIQIDKIYDRLSRPEQMQVLEEMGISPDPNAEVAGLPDASKTMQAHQHLKDTAAREEGKMIGEETKRMKINTDAMVKMKGMESAVQDKKDGRRGEGRNA